MRVIRAVRLPGGEVVFDAPSAEEALAALRSGGLVVYPTDTLYGLGCDPSNASAVDRVFAVKARPRDLPIALALGSVEEIPRFAHMTALSSEFCAKHLPGPVTILLRATPAAPAPLVSKDGLLGIRVPDDTITRWIAKAFGPITTTSANRHAGAAPATCDEALQQLGDAADVYIDGGPTRHGKESTIVDLTGSSAKVIREGVLRREDL